MEEVINTEISGLEAPSKPKKRFLNKNEIKKNLILLLLTILLMIVFLEIFLRLFYPQKIYNSCYESDLRNESTLDVKLDPYLGWAPRENYSGCTYRPDTNKIIFKTYNSQGIRLNKEISYEKGDKKRVILLGDSFVDGLGLNDSDTIAIKMQENLGEGYEVIPFASSGYATGMELLFLEKEILKYRPDIVMLFFYPNDFTETHSPGKLGFADRPGFYLIQQISVREGTDPQKKMEYISQEIGLGNHYVLLDQIINPKKEYILSNETTLVTNFPTKMIWNYKAGEKKLPLSMEKPFTSFLLKSFHFYSLIYHNLPKLYFISKIKYSDRTTDGIDLFLEKENDSLTEIAVFSIIKLFDEFKRESQENSFKFILVNIPEKRNINQEYQRKFLDQYSDVNESFFEFRKIDNTFNEILPSHNIEYISLFDLAQNNFDDFYFKTDPHWSPEGVKLSADYITEKLKERKII